MEQDGGQFARRGDFLVYPDRRAAARYLRRYANINAKLAAHTVFQIWTPSCHNSSIAFAESTKATLKTVICI
jgi:hypothetical protein